MAEKKIHTAPFPYTHAPYIYLYIHTYIKVCDFTIHVEMGGDRPLPFSTVNREYALGCALPLRSHIEHATAIVVT